MPRGLNVFMLPAIFLLAALPLVTTAATPTATPAAQWQSVATESGRSVDIDTARITRLPGGKTAAWTRLTLDHAVLDFEGGLRYTAVQALNHYDCTAGRFATQRRVFLLDGRQMKTEKVSGPPLAVQPDSLDAQVLEAVCKPRTAGEAQETAKRAAAAAQVANAQRPRPMHAEMVSNAEAAAARSMKVAEPRAPQTPSATEKPADKPAERPRMFELPLIDKSKAEDPYAKTDAKPPQPAPAPVPPKVAERPAPKPVAPPVAQARPAPKAAPPESYQELSRQQRELMLATSGPRKTPRNKKAPAEPPPPDYSKAQWGYAGLGAPENWHLIKPAYALCGKGTRQSPIDIRSGIRVDLEPIRFDYRPSQFRIFDSGHAIEVHVGEGNRIMMTGRSYRLISLVFRRPAEEKINGRSFDMSVQLVHQDDDGSLAVVAVMLERGSEHPVIQTLWNYMPLEVGMDVMPPNVYIDLNRLLPENREYYTYMGSLTTPPCTENVLWLVLKQPQQVSPQQIGIFARLYPHNARPLQPVNDRLIKESR